jgi:hypothetical protein
MRSETQWEANRSNYSDLSKNRFGRRLSLHISGTPAKDLQPLINSSLKSTDEQPCMRGAAKNACSLHGPQGCANAHPSLCRLEPLCKHFVHLRHTPFFLRFTAPERRRFSICTSLRLFACRKWLICTQTSLASRSLQTGTRLILLSPLK